MKGTYAATLRRLIPGAAVAGVLAFSYVASGPLSALGSNVGYGYGGNNCGIKGDGFHDHGKVCPNRPFPGHGNGVIAILGGALTVGGATGAATTTGATNTKAHGKAGAALTSTGTTTAESANETTETATKGHNGHGKALGLARRHHFD